MINLPPGFRHSEQHAKMHVSHGLVADSIPISPANLVGC
jgi:hypothetical protein